MEQRDGMGKLRATKNRLFKRLKHRDQKHYLHYKYSVKEDSAQDDIVQEDSVQRDSAQEVHDKGDKGKTPGLGVDVYSRP